MALLGIKAANEEQKEETQEDKETTPETERWLGKSKGSWKEAREKHNMLQGKADAEDESQQPGTVMESQATPQAVPIN